MIEHRHLMLPCAAGIDQLCNVLNQLANGDGWEVVTVLVQAMAVPALPNGRGPVLLGQQQAEPAFVCLLRRQVPEMEVSQ